MNCIVQIATTYQGTLYALCADGSVWEQVKTGSGGHGTPEYKWVPVKHPFPIATAGDAELRSW